ELRLRWRCGNQAQLHSPPFRPPRRRSPPRRPRLATVGFPRPTDQPDSVMTIDSVTTLVEALRYERLLAQDQLAQLTEEVLAGFDSPRALAKYLVQLGWLTVYQINHLFEGHA